MRWEMMYKSRLRLLVAGLLIFLTVLISASVWAGGGGSYPEGAESFMVGAVPPPGFYFKNYAYY